ncbi:MAG: flagellar hook-associated protein FlgK, partial [Clostridiales bacterium]|nr:flagellar hook-associated protein FlgK [Clostridiales bacterium]
MRSTFYGLEIARKGLFISQKGLDVTGHNIANANTPGYTRQRLVTSSVEPGVASDGIFTYTSKGQVGAGVTIQELSQIRDKFIDMQFRRENTKLGEWSAKTEAFQYIEDVFREPSDAGLNAVLADFFSDIQEMAKNPESKEIRALVRQDAIKLTETLHHYYDQMIQLQSEQDTAINITVNEINDIVKNIRDLNEQIFRFEIGGEKANDLRDQRNLLVDRMSSLIKIDYYETPDGRFRIDINGMSLVNHTQYQAIEAVKDVKNPAG